MPINLISNNNNVWASQGKVEEISPEKIAQGWTGAPSDFAFNTIINKLFQQGDLRYNAVATLINQMLQKGVPDYNALYQYSTDSVITHAGKIYRAKQPNAGHIPPSGMVSDDYWELIVGQQWVLQQLALKADSNNPSFTGAPEVPTPTSQSSKNQIANVEYVESEMLKRIRGESIIDLSQKESSKAYPILLAKDNIATDSIIYRYIGLGNDTLGNMRLVVKGLGCGLNKRNLSFLEVINLNDSAEADIGNFVKKIQTRNQNTCIAIWLKGGAKYYINQRNNEAKWELIESATTLEDNWLVSVEEWINTQFIGDGVWSVEKQTDLLIDYTSTSDTGAIETCGVVGWCASKTAPNGALIANGSAVSRTTYSKLFNKIGVHYGVGDGQSTFNLPDLRGVVPRGLDMGRGIDSNQLITQSYGGTTDRQTIEGLGSYQSDAIRNITGYAGTMWNTGDGKLFTARSQGQVSSGSSYSWVAQNFNAGAVVPTASKNQIDNIALLPFIYYL